MRDPLAASQNLLEVDPSRPNSTSVDEAVVSDAPLSGGWPSRNAMLDRWTLMASHGRRPS